MCGIASVAQGMLPHDNWVLGKYGQTVVRRISSTTQVRPTHTRLVPGSKHDWCKNPLVFAMIAS